MNERIRNGEEATVELRKERASLVRDIVREMNELYKLIDPEGNNKYTGLFTGRNEIYSGSEATVFHLVKLFALQRVLGHNYPIVVDSFRAEDLSTEKEKMVLKVCKSLGNQVILTTTLKQEEIGKYDSQEGINHISYFSHAPSKILDIKYVSEFMGIMSDFSLKI